MATPASANVSAKKKAHITRQLKKAVKKSPAVVSKKWFLKKASLVDFKLPVTIRLRGSSTASNPNQANIDLGASLGQREIELGGSLAAEIRFHDSYEGGALGNVDVNLLPSSTKKLSSTSVPLLWNQDVSAAGTSWDSTLLKFGGFSDTDLDSLGHNPGCGDVHNTNANADGNLPFGLGVLAGLDQASAGPPAVAPGDPMPGTGHGLPGVPIHHPVTDAVIGFAPAHIASTSADVNNDIDAIQPGKAITGIASKDNNTIGGSVNPFPYSADSQPDGGYAPTAADTILRTNALKLGIADIGEVDQSTNTDGVTGGQNIVVGKSGGQANLFGNIPGKSTGIDVTVNLKTRINSILRIEDQDADRELVATKSWPAAVFSCGQVWTGGVDNYITGVRLAGSLKISPAITSDGHLRIAKALLSTPGVTATSPGDVARVALAACLVPKQSYNEETGQNTVPIPGAGTVINAAGVLSPAVLAAKSSVIASAPAGDCNSTPSTLVANSALPPNTVQTLHPPTDGAYTVDNSGSVASVAGDLSVKSVSADILVGDV